MHPKTARREEKSDKKKEERIGAQLMAEINLTDDTATAIISDPTWTWKPSSSHDLQPTWALPLTAWVEQRHALGDVQIHATGAEIRTGPGSYGNGAARASSHLKLPQARRPSTLQLLTAAASSTRSTEFNVMRPGDRPPPSQLRIRSVRLYMRCRMICRACRCY